LTHTAPDHKLEYQTQLKVFRGTDKACFSTPNLPKTQIFPAVGRHPSGTHGREHLEKDLDFFLVQTLKQTLKLTLTLF